MSRRWQHRTAGVIALLALGVVAWFLLHTLTGSTDTGTADEKQKGVRTAEFIEGQAQGVGLAVPKKQRLVGTDGELIAHGSVAVHVTNLSGDGLYGVTVKASTHDPNKPVRSAGVTDTDGWARFVDLPYDGTWTVSIEGKGISNPAHQLFRQTGLRILMGAGSGLPRVPVEGPRVDLKLSVLPLTVDAEASDDGTALFGIKCSLAPSVGGAGWETGDLLPLQAWIPKRESASLSLQLLSVRPDDGYVVHDSVSGSFAIAPQARQLHAVIPLRPEAELYAQPPHATEWTYTVFLDGERVKKIEAYADVFGRQRVRRVPFLPGASVRILAHAPQNRRAWGKATFGQRPGDPLFVELHTVDKQGMKEFAALIPTGGNGLQFRRMSWSGGISRIQAVNIDTEVAKLLEIRVKRADGRPAIGASVALRGKPAVATDHLGRARIQKVPVGKYRATVWGAGAAFAQDIEVAKAKRQVAHFRAPAAATIDLEVVDKDGHAVPHASIAVEQGDKLPWSDIDGDTQRVDPYTDVLGRRMLHNVRPDAPLVVTATFGKRVGSAKFAIKAGHTESVRLVLGMPKAQPKKQKRRTSRVGSGLAEVGYRFAVKSGKHFVLFDKNGVPLLDNVLPKAK